MLLHRLFKSEDSRFMLSTAFKLVGILLFVTILVAFDLLQYIRVNYLFLKANGFVGVEELKQAYFDFILSSESLWFCTSHCQSFPSFFNSRTPFLTDDITNSRIACGAVLDL